MVHSNFKGENVGPHIWMKIQGNARTLKLLLLTKASIINLMWDTLKSLPTWNSYPHYWDKTQCMHVPWVKKHSMSWNKITGRIPNLIRGTREGTSRGIAQVKKMEPWSTTSKEPLWPGQPLGFVEWPQYGAYGEHNKGHFTHEPRAMTMKLWESKRKCPKAVPTHLPNHVVWLQTLKCSMNLYVIGSLTKCYFNEFSFMQVLTDDK